MKASGPTRIRLSHKQGRHTKNYLTSGWPKILHLSMLCSRGEIIIICTLYQLLLHLTDSNMFGMHNIQLQHYAFNQKRMFYYNTSNDTQPKKNFIMKKLFLNIIMPIPIVNVNLIVHFIYVILNSFITKMVKRCRLLSSISLAFIVKIIVS